MEKELARNRQIVDEEKVAEVVAMMTGYLFNGLLWKRANVCCAWENNLKQCYSQDEAIEKVVKSIQRNRAGLKDPTSQSAPLFSSVPPVLGKHNWPRYLHNISLIHSIT